MKVSVYLSLNKSREVEIGRALEAGFARHGDTVEILPTEGYTGPKDGAQIGVMVGVKGRSKQIYEDHRRSGRHTLLVDKSYFGRGDYYRVILDGFQPRYAHDEPRPHDRLERLGVKLQPKRARGRYMIYAGSSQKYCDWHGLGDATSFADGVCYRINKFGPKDMPVLYRPKPSWAAGHPEEAKPIRGTQFSGPKESLASRLPDCHALVTHGSNAAIEAIAAGVPAILVSSEGACAAWPLAETADLDEAHLREPFFPDDAQRRQVFADLAYCKFTLDEIASGFCWETLMSHTIKGLKDLEGLSETDRDIALYKLMHQGYKVFRGSSLKGHTEAVTRLVEEHKPETLLDYGSGKGRQYDELNLHERWGGLKPTCYDPGWEPYAQKPSGTFDGVICTDVAEHIPESGVDAFLADVIGYANKFAFFCIFTEPARKFLPDGRNCHLTVRPSSWWLDKISEVTGGIQIENFMVRKALPGGASEDFPHHRIRTPQGVDVVVTFRGAD